MPNQENENEAFAIQNSNFLETVNPRSLNDYSKRTKLRHKFLLEFDLDIAMVILTDKKLYQQFLTANQFTATEIVVKEAVKKLADHQFEKNLETCSVVEIETAFRKSLPVEAALAEPCDKLFAHITNRVNFAKFKQEVLNSENRYYPDITKLTATQRNNVQRFFLEENVANIITVLQNPEKLLHLSFYGTSPDKKTNDHSAVLLTNKQVNAELQRFFIQLMKSAFVSPLSSVKIAIFNQTIASSSSEDVKTEEIFRTWKTS